MPSVSTEKVKLWSYPDSIGSADHLLAAPALARPRPGLRIAPGRLSGSPHVAHTRLETSALYALQRDGLGPDAILSFYPYLATEQLAEALDLERQLADNLAMPSAA